MKPFKFKTKEQILTEVEKITEDDKRKKLETLVIVSRIKNAGKDIISENTPSSDPERELSDDELRLLYGR